MNEEPKVYGPPSVANKNAESQNENNENAAAKKENYFGKKGQEIGITLFKMAVSFGLVWIIQWFLIHFWFHAYNYCNGLNGDFWWVHGITFFFVVLIIRLISVFTPPPHFLGPGIIISFVILFTFGIVSHYNNGYFDAKGSPLRWYYAKVENDSVVKYYEVAQLVLDGEVLHDTIKDSQTKRVIEVVDYFIHPNNATKCYRLTKEIKEKMDKQTVINTPKPTYDIIKCEPRALSYDFILKANEMSPWLVFPEGNIAVTITSNNHKYNGLYDNDNDNIVDETMVDVEGDAKWGDRPFLKFKLQPMVDDTLRVWVRRP